MPSPTIYSFVFSFQPDLSLDCMNGCRAAAHQAVRQSVKGATGRGQVNETTHARPARPVSGGELE